MNALTFLSAASLARRIARGSLSARDALEFHLERHERLHPRLNAIVVTDIPAARKRARAIDRARARGDRLGPLAGVPMTVKESFDIAGLPTTWGLDAHRSNIAQRDALVVERLRAAGAVIWGKSNVPVLLADWQTFNPVYGTTHSPWGEGLTPGGSSGGAASALAAGISALEYGSDIGGSIRGPAHLCGVYGHKTTYAIVPGAGHALPGNWSAPEISVVGPLARSPGDLVLALSATAGPAGQDASAYQLRLPKPVFTTFKGLRIAVLPTHPATRVAHAVSDEIEKLARFIARQGAKVVLPAVLPFDAAEHDRLYLRLRRAATSMRAFDDAGFARALEERAALAPDDFSYAADQLRGNTLTHREWVLLENERSRIRLRWNDFFRDVDFLLCPGAATVAYPQNQQGRRWERMIDVDGVPMPDVLQIFWMGFASLGGLPATQAPIALTAQGLPTSVQIIGPRYADLSTIRLAQLIERAYHAFTPPPGFE
ncbi:MAG: amidase [Proteobacteria bacterium]|nr:amidase [Burkholderiales bacterium]